LKLIIDSKSYSKNAIKYCFNLKHGIEISVEEGSTSTNAQTITSPTHFEFLCSSSGQLIAPEHKITSHVSL
jgi:hypothetical protein